MSPSPNAPQIPPEEVPSEAEFLRLNKRRCELIHKKFLEGGISPEEDVELQRLEIPVSAYVNFHHPLPPVNLEYLQELAREAGLRLDWVEGS